MTILRGLLVDLVPYDQRYIDREHTWLNSEAWFWATAGDRPIVTRASLARERAEEQANAQPNGGVWFGIQAKDGTPLGDISLFFYLPAHRVAMLGAGIGEPAYWGGGYGTDALLLFIDYAFNWLDMRKLWLSTLSLNARVIRQMEKVGFTHEGTRRGMWFAEGQWQDDMVYGLLREEWPGREAVVARLGLTARG